MCMVGVSNKAGHHILPTGRFFIYSYLNSTRTLFNDSTKEGLVSVFSKHGAGIAVPLAPEKTSSG
jgi:hypothetical protein